MPMSSAAIPAMIPNTPRAMDSGRMARCASASICDVS
jgi:hypothetical protein